MIAALALALTLQPAGPPVIQSSPQPPAAATPMDADTVGMVLASTLFVFSCVPLLDTASSGGDYAASVQKLADQMTPRAMKEQTGFDQLPVTLDAVHGDSCRIRYSGARQDLAWSLLTKFADAAVAKNDFRRSGDGGHIVLSASADRSRPAQQIVFDKKAAAHDVTILVTWQGSKLP